MIPGAEDDVLIDAFQYVFDDAPSYRLSGKSSTVATC